MEEKRRASACQLDDLAEQKIGQVKEAIIEWKAKGEVSKLNVALTGPSSMLPTPSSSRWRRSSDAEEAIIDALLARIDAEEAEAPAAAAR